MRKVKISISLKLADELYRRNYALVINLNELIHQYFLKMIYYCVGKIKLKNA